MLNNRELNNDENNHGYYFAIIVQPYLGEC